MKNKKVKYVGEEISSKRKRNAKRMPIGETKSEIVLFIAEKRTADTIDIKRYLKNRSNIKNKKSLLIHLLDLTENGLLKKKSKGKGNPDVYYLSDNFHTLQTTFNYLKKLHKEKELMKTTYFKNYISSEDFKIKFFVHLIKEISLSMFEYIKSDEGYTILVEDNKIYNSKEGKIIIESIKNDKISDAEYTKLEDIGKVLALYNSKKPKNMIRMISSLVAILKNSDVDKLTEFISSFGSDLSSFIQKAPSFIIPDKETPEILAILRASPTAIDFIINFRNLNPIELMGIFIRFLVWSINDDPEKAKMISILMNDKENLRKNISQIYALLKDFSKVENKSPIYTLIASMFLIDYINRNIIINDSDQLLLSDVLNNMLLPKIKTVVK